MNEDLYCKNFDCPYYRSFDEEDSDSYYSEDTLNRQKYPQYGGPGNDQQKPWPQQPNQWQQPWQSHHYSPWMWQQPWQPHNPWYYHKPWQPNYNPWMGKNNPWYHGK